MNEIGRARQAIPVGPICSEKVKAIASSLGQSHASAYRKSLAVSSTTISYSVYVVTLGVCLRFKPSWMFHMYKCVIKGPKN